jgi:two-component system, NtrC family, response regulator AtoC
MNLSGLGVLVVDDDPMLRKRLVAQLENLEAEVATAEDLQTARKLVSSKAFDFVLLDVNLPDGSGTDLLKEQLFPTDTGVIVMTAHGGVGGAVEAMRLGALDYLVKPFESGELPLVIERARQAQQSARGEEHRRKDNPGSDFYFSPSLAALESQLQRILDADQRMRGPLPPILIQGETGTGKTAIARWLHQRGPRAKSELIEVNCSALPETLAESELFGHEQGAFTDARKARMGLFEAADGGTLFLDEVPSLSAALHAKVLTAIEDRKIRRVGANKALLVDARLIAATNRDLKTLVAEGKFREDLYHRLDLYRIAIPPLRERGEDIVKMAELFRLRFCNKHRLKPKTISSAGKQRLRAHPWPGNVRELAHEMERAVVFEDKAELNFDSLSHGDDIPQAEAATTWLNPAFRFPETGFSLEEAIEKLLRQALEQADGNVSAASRLLGVPRDYIRYRLGQKDPKTGGK